MKDQRFVICLLLFAFFSAPIYAEEPQSVWPDYGLEINNTPGNTPQQNPKTISGADGCHIVVWEDGRRGFTNLYAQKIDANGSPLWDRGGIAVAPFAGNQNYLNLTDDGAGGTIVVWQDYRNGNSDIFTQRLSSQGELLWGSEGMPISKAPAGQFAPELVSDGASGAIVTWHDYRSGVGEDVYAQRVDKDGKVLWAADGIPVCEANGTQWYPTITGDGRSGAIIVWTDGRGSSADNNIYGQRVDFSGKALWEKDGIPICSAPQNQERPAILGLEGIAIVAWNDSRNGNIDLYSQKIDLEGKPIWASDGIAISTAPFSQENPRLAPDGAGGAIVTWVDTRKEEEALFAQRVNKEGKLEWGENGRAVAGASGKQVNPEIVKTSSGWVITWEDYRKGSPFLFAQKINNAGTGLWQEGGTPLAAGENAQEKAALVASPNDEVIIAWQDRRSGNYDIYAQKLSPQGAPLWGGKAAVVCDAQGMVLHQNVNSIKNSQGDVILVFEDARSGYLNIYAQKISKAGTLSWGKDGIPVAKAKAPQTNPQLVPDGADGAIVVWEDLRDPSFPKIYAQRISAAGKKVWETGSLPLSKVNSRQSRPLAVPDKAGGALVVWVDERNPLSLKDLYGQRISNKGELLWNKNGVALCPENGDQVEAVLIADGAGGAVTAWTDYRNGERNPDIYAQRIDGSGKLLWPAEGLLVCGAPDIQRTPQIMSDEGGVIIAWTDKGGGSYDIYAQRITLPGQTAWMKDGIPISQSARTQQNPLMVNGRIIIWEDYRYGNWDLFVGALSPQGKVLKEEGNPIVTLPLTQYAPQAIAWKNGAILAWEDYRSGKQYEIFMQKINGEGEIVWAENGVLLKTTNGARAPKLLALPEQGSFFISWEDYTAGGKALYGQRFTAY